MFYDFAITIPANTPKASPVVTELKLTAGVIHRVEIQFPAGCMGLAHIAINDGLHQLLPTNPDGDFASDDYVIPIDEYYPMPGGDYILTARGWNMDDTYPHTLSVRIGILSGDVIAPLSGLGGALKKFLKLVGIGG
jgi:hypothetical protein